MHRKVTLLELEGLAINNLIKLYKVDECFSNKHVRYVKIYVETVNGEHLETECLDQKRINKIIAILTNYQKWSRDIAGTPSHE